MKLVIKTLILIGFVMIMAGLAVAAPGATERVSVSSAEDQANHMSGRRGRPELSADGRFVAFDSFASNLVSSDTNNLDDIFVRDRVNGTTERVSVSSSGSQANNESTRPAISADGNFIAFQSVATNLVAGDTNGESDVFVRNRANGQTTRVSVASDGAQGNDTSFLADISADGRYVVFSSDATNLVANKTTIFRDIYVHDRLTGTTERVNLGNDGAEANSNTFIAHISGDGRFVTFNSLASNLVPGDTNGGLTDIFVRDLINDTTERVSVSSDEAEANGISNAPFLSFDGRYVVFSSDATNLVPGDTNDTKDIFVRDRLNGTTERVSVSSDGTQSNGSSDGPGVRGGASFGPDISADGRFVTFDSIATNLVPGDTNTCEAPAVPPFDVPGQCPDIFVRDRLNGTTERFSVSSEGAQSNHASTDPAISPNGNAVAFFTLASNLAPGDTNTCAIPPQVIFDDPGECPDIYVHDVTAAPPPTPTATATPTTGATATPTPLPTTTPTPGPGTTVTAFPNGTTILAGTLRSGTAASLNADDNVYFQVNSTTAGSPTAAWYGSFNRVSNALSDLKITYQGKNSKSVIQTVAIWNWTTSAWVQLDSRSVGTREVLIADLMPGGTLADYVSGATGDGQVRVRIRATGNSGSFFTSGDLLKIVYNRP